MRLTKVVWWDSRTEAKTEEERAIKAELPKYNDKMNQDNPIRVIVRKAKRRQPTLLDDEEPDEVESVPAAGEWPLLDPSPAAPPHRHMFHRRTDRAPRHPRPEKVKVPARQAPDYFPWE